MNQPDMQTLHILWTNADPTTARMMVFMYAANSKLHGWWQNVTVIIWGATAKLAAQDEAIREHMAFCARQGVRFSACITCAQELGVADTLKNQGIELIPWGEPLTELIKSGAPLLTI